MLPLGHASGEPDIMNDCITICMLPVNDDLDRSHRADMISTVDRFICRTLRFVWLRRTNRYPPRAANPLAEVVRLHYVENEPVSHPGGGSDVLFTVRGRVSRPSVQPVTSVQSSNSLH